MTAARDTDVGSLPEGTTLGSFRVVRFIARGGMGEVYEVANTITGARRALKLVRSDLLTDADASARFVREVGIAAAIRHPNVVECGDPFFDAGTIALPMELLQGETLSTRLGLGPLELGEAVDVALAIARGLEAFHAIGVIHRDVKPGNVFLAATPGGTVPKVLDFGAARDQGESTHTLTGHVIGSPSYMAPEQAMGVRDLDARVDVYALGVVLYAMLTGRRPYESDAHGTAVSKLIQRRAYAPVRTLRRSVPVALSDVVDRALAWDRGERFPAMTALRQALEGVRDEVGHVDGRASLTERAAEPLGTEERTGALTPPVDAPLTPFEAPPTSTASRRTPAEATRASPLPIYAGALALTVFGVIAGVSVFVWLERGGEASRPSAPSALGALDAGPTSDAPTEPADAGLDVGDDAPRDAGPPDVPRPRRRVPTSDPLWLDPDDG